MGLTIKQMAKRLKISRAGVELRMNHIPNFRSKYIKQVGNKYIINEEGSKALASGKTPVTPHNNKLEVLKKQITSLKKSLNSEKNHNQYLRKLMNQTTSNANNNQKQLENLLDHQQQLQLSTEKQNNELQNQIKQLKGPIKNNSSKAQAQSRNHKKGFWSRFFGGN